jgi:hypothetical protein
MTLVVLLSVLVSLALLANAALSFSGGYPRVLSWIRLEAALLALIVTISIVMISLRVYR